MFTRGYTTWELLNLIVDSAAFAYICLSTGFYVLSKTIPHHSSLTTHLFLITGALTLHFYFSTIGQYLAFTLSPHLTWAEYAALGVSFFTTIWVGLIPLKSGLYEDPARLYSKAVCTAIISEEAKNLSNHPEPTHNAHEPLANVVSDSSVSIISRLTTAWITPTITKTASMEQCDVQDLPVIRAEIRTQNLIREVGGQGLGKSTWGPTVALLWTVWAPQVNYLLQGKPGVCSLLQLCSSPQVGGPNPEVPVWHVSAYNAYNVIPGSHRMVIVRCTVLTPSIPRRPRPRIRAQTNVVHPSHLPPERPVVAGQRLEQAERLRLGRAPRVFEGREPPDSCHQDEHVSGGAAVDLRVRC